MIHLGHGLFDQFGSGELSDELTSLYGDCGVELLLEEEVASFGEDEFLRYVETKSGSCVEADMAVVGVGVAPNVEWLATSGVGLDNGVVVNARLETSAAGVYAAGDVANFYDPLYRRQRRIEHWSNANYQGTEVGKILAGRAGGYDTVSSFFSQVFDTTIKVFGDVSRFDELNTDGSLASGTFVASYGNKGQLVGALAIGQSNELETLVKDLIAERAPFKALARGCSRPARMATSRSGSVSSFVVMGPRRSGQREHQGAAGRRPPDAALVGPCLGVGELRNNA